MILLTRLHNLMRSYVNAKNLGFFFSIYNAAICEFRFRRPSCRL